MATYQDRMLDGASPVELVVALYDGILRFLYAAIAAVERGDIHGRRVAVKRALAIVIHLQARLRMDIGGRPAQVLSEYYASMFALIVQASLGASVPRFEEVIGCIRNVRDAWRQVASDPTAQVHLQNNPQVNPQMNSQGDARAEAGQSGTAPIRPGLIQPPEAEPSRWTA
jgi:flagellar protein FliS